MPLKFSNLFFKELKEWILKLIVKSPRDFSKNQTRLRSPNAFSCKYHRKLLQEFMELFRRFSAPFQQKKKMTKFEESNGQIPKEIPITNPQVNPRKEGWIRYGIPWRTSWRHCWKHRASNFLKITAGITAFPGGISVITSGGI